MGIPQSCLEARQECAAFSNKLEIAGTLLNLLNYGNSLFIRLPLFGQIVQNYLKGRKFIRLIRSITNSCQKECNDVDCLKLLYEPVKQVRDSFLDLYNQMEQTNLRLPFLKKITQKTLDELDELVTDCFVGCDDEFRSLIFQIAEKS